MPNKTYTKIIALLLPGVSFITLGRIKAAILCFFLQLTVIGWIPAAMWAFASINSDSKKRRVDKVLKSVREYTVLPASKNGETSIGKLSVAKDDRQIR